MKLILLLIIWFHSNDTIDLKNNQYCFDSRIEYEETYEFSNSIYNVDSLSISKRISLSKKSLRKCKSILKRLVKTKCKNDADLISLLQMQLALGNKNMVRRKVQNLLNSNHLIDDKTELSLIELLIASEKWKRKNMKHKIFRRRKTNISPCPFRSEEYKVFNLHRNLKILKDNYGSDLVLRYFKYNPIPVNGSSKDAYDVWIRIFNIFKACLKENLSLESFIEEYIKKENTIIQHDDLLNYSIIYPHFPFVMNGKKKVNEFLLYSCFNSDLESGTTSITLTKKKFNQSFFIKTLMD